MNTSGQKVNWSDSISMTELREASQQRSLFFVSHGRIFRDFFLVASLAWLGFFLACYSWNSKPLNFIFFLISIILISRAIGFAHEVVHLEMKVSHLARIYDLFLGYWLRLPIYLFRLHRVHHSAHRFGTIDDPEHFDLREKNPWFFLPFKIVLEPLASPLILLLRFSFVTIGWVLVGKRARDFVFRRWSTIQFESGFQRVGPDPEEASEMLRADLACLVITMVQIGATWTFHNPKLLLVWYFGVAFSSATAFVRTLVLHNYHVGFTEKEHYLDVHLAGTNVVERSSLAWIWAPFHLNFHATHHLFPGIPYYSLPAAHALALEKIQPPHAFHNSLRVSFWHTLGRVGREWMRERKNH